MVLKSFLLNISQYSALKGVDYRRLFAALGIVTLGLMISACNQAEDSATVSDGEFSTIEWTDLIPKDDLEALRNRPDFIDSIVDGSAEDQIDSQIQSKLDGTPETAYQKALVSSNVVSTFDKKNIRLPGFIVPLEFDENFVVTEFFLVPYFGACLHSPPPPPNQIVYVKMNEGIPLESIEQPYWISGLLTTVGEINDTAHAAYSMSASDVALYEVEAQE